MMKKNTGITPDFSDFILSEMPGQIAVFNTDLQYIYVSPGAIKKQEIREWIIGKTDLDYCRYRNKPEELAHSRMQKLKQVLETGKSVQWEETLVDSQGNVQIFSRKLSRVKDEARNTIYLVGYGLDITHIVRMKEDMERQKNFLDLVLDTSPHLIFVKDSERRFLLVNKATADAFGMSKEEIQSRLNAEVHPHEKELNLYDDADDKVFKNNTTVRLEEHFTRFNGDEIIYDTIKTPLNDNDGIKKLLGISTNITEQKKNHEQALQRELELIDAQELTHSGNWRYDIKSGKIECSKGLLSLLELKDNKVLSLETLAEMCMNGFKDHFMQAVKNAQELGIESQQDLLIRTESGVKSIVATFRMRMQSDGEESMLFGTMLDVTDLKKIENELRHKEQRLNLVSKLGKTGSFEYDLTTREITWSPGTYEIFEKNITDGPPTVEEFFEHIHPDDLHIVLDAMQQSRKGIEHVSTDYRIITYKGNLKYASNITQPEYNEAGEIIRVIGSTTDITERKETERELRLNRQHLEEAQDLARLGSWRLYPAENRIWWSDGCFKIWERPKELGEPSLEEFLQSIHISDRQRVVNSLKNLLQVGVGNIVDYRIVNNKGNLKHVYVRSKTAFTPDGSIDHFFGTIIDLTEVKEAERKLRKSEDLLNEAQKLAFIGSWEYDPSTEIISWSDGHFKLWERDKANGSPTLQEYLETIDEDYRDILRKRLEELMNDGGRAELEYTVKLPSGRKAFMKSVAYAEMDSEARLQRMYGTVIDVTERHERELKIRSSEESLLEAQTLSRMGSWEYDLKDKQLNWSAGMYDLWKRDKNLPPPTLHEFLKTVHEEDRDLVSNMFRKIYSDGESQELEFRLISGENEWLYTYARVFARYSPENSMISLHGTIMDISERKRNEELLKESERSLVEAQEMSRSGNFSYNFEDGSRQWSSGMFKLLGLTDNIIPPVTETRKWLKEGEIERIAKYYEVILASDEGGEIEFEINTPGGRTLILLAHSKPVKDSKGKLIQITGTVTDITQQAEAQKILIEMRDRSEEMIKAKEYFLANISHELKTPLNGILGMARLLQKTDLNPTQRKYTDILNSTAGNLLVIINDILDVAKMESGKLALESIPFDLRQVADQAVQVQMFRAEEKDLALRHFQIGNPPPLVIGDPYRLNQILLNLLSNAIKFTQTGEIVVTQQTLSETNEDVIIEFAVQDTGIGISKEKAEKIFESFMQVHDNTHQHYGGTGLGLTISRTLVEMQGGSIHVDSEPGKGSRFYFRIPYKKAASDAEVSTAQQRFDLKNLGALRILLAEDNRVNQFITEAMLLDWGFKVDIADNGLQALELVKKNNYDLILMDIQMPGMSGVEATRTIRMMDDKIKSHIPIIALTANTTKNAQRKFLAEGMNDCLVKPFKEETLFRRILLQLEGEERFKMGFPRKRYPVRKQPTPSGDQLFNLNLLRNDSPNNAQFILKMLQIFLDTIPPIIEKMSEHFDKGEMDAISSLAHKIKPTLDGTGISSLHETIRNMENYREKKRTREQMLSDLTRVKEVIGLVTGEFRKKIENLKI